MIKASPKKQLFDNCKILSIDGDFLGYCDYKRVIYYVRKNLADKIDDKTIQLKFKESGRRTNSVGIKKNVCVVCGTSNNLTRHHTVPKCYLKFFPLDIKKHYSYDILPLCVKCHKKYEKESHYEKNNIADIYGVVRPGKENKIKSTELNRIRSIQKTLEKYKHQMPESRISELNNKLDILFKKMNIEPFIVNGGDIIVEKDILHGEQVVSKLKDINSFINHWRLHFIETMKPSYMHEWWNVEHKYVL